MLQSHIEGRKKSTQDERGSNLGERGEGEGKGVQDQV